MICPRLSTRASTLTTESAWLLDRRRSLLSLKLLDSGDRHVTMGLRLLSMCALSCGTRFVGLLAALLLTS